MAKYNTLSVKNSFLCIGAMPTIPREIDFEINIKKKKKKKKVMNTIIPSKVHSALELD